MKKPAGALSVDDISSVVIIQQEATLATSSWREANKMKRRRAEASADGLALMTSSVTSSYSADGLKEQSQESADSAGRLCVDNQAQSIQSTKISAEDEFSRCDKSVAKQLTIYESWMSTSERNSNGESDKTQSTLKMERING
ncbi:BEACH domain-containing protein lvsC [Dorcoceras hygrometricum]|uniref:BEACH domain-containing protein lvsC n=1 Tax=Dorcoceras hygrometricum TaxID=472368 RepID=A0A2Z7D362_9LAMI|nr:BEACH domain-containing protein lvsC [Dorcoceras hygrometricum]